jgi:hypothetical protein
MAIKKSQGCQTPALDLQEKVLDSSSRDHSIESQQYNRAQYCP